VDIAPVALELLAAEASFAAQDEAQLDHRTGPPFGCPAAVDTFDLDAAAVTARTTAGS
jgi:hypothetical protein